MCSVILKVEEDVFFLSGKTRGFVLLNREGMFISYSKVGNALFVRGGMPWWQMK